MRTPVVFFVWVNIEERLKQEHFLSFGDVYNDDKLKQASSEVKVFGEQQKKATHRRSAHHH